MFHLKATVSCPWPSQAPGHSMMHNSFSATSKFLFFNKTLLKSPKSETSSEFEDSQCDTILKIFEHPNFNGT